jgi:pyruvate formate lyase activating enzyme
MSSCLGTIFDIQRYSVHDGPGIRTTVFLKGCPLNCLWCSNPESQSKNPEIMLDHSLCTRCGRCVEVCPYNATVKSGDEIRLLRDLCQGCSECVSACPNDARQLVGRQEEVETILKEVKNDGLFYKNSGGRVTLSGGEPMSQPEFTRALLKRCKENGIHTVLDSSGYTNLENWDLVLEYVDMILFDLKQMEPEKHKEYTGVERELILKSAKKVASLKVPMIIRIPLIPGYNDSQKNMEECARFAKEIGVDRIELLAFHRLCSSKYNKLDKEWRLDGVPSPDKGLLEKARVNFTAHGLTCSY